MTIDEHTKEIADACFNSLVKTAGSKKAADAVIQLAAELILILHSQAAGKYTVKEMCDYVTLRAMTPGLNKALAELEAKDDAGLS